MNFRDKLTEIELETNSRLIFSPCEAARGMDDQEIEMELMGSFIEWATQNMGPIKEGLRGSNQEVSK